MMPKWAVCIFIFFLSVLLRHVFLKVARGFARIVTVITARGLFSGVIVLSGHQLEYLNICNDHIWKVSLQNVSLRGSWGCQLVWRIFHIECSGKVDLLNEFSCALWDFHLLCRSTQVFLEGTILCAGEVTLSTFEKLFSWMSSNVLLHVTSLYTQVITLRAFKRLFTWMLVFPETIKCGASVATLFAFESLFSWMCPQLMWF